MFFGFPLALWAFSALPALGAIYWFRNRYKPYTVSSLLLWDQFSLARGGGRKAQRLNTTILFFIEMLILILLALAAALPMLPISSAVRNIAVILDDSFSMQASSDSFNVRQNAIDAVMAEFGSFGRTRMTLIAAGEKPGQLAANISSKTELEKALQSWTCNSYRSDISQAIALAQSLVGSEGDIMVISDHPPQNPLADDDNIFWRSVGDLTRNTAIVNAVRTNRGEKDEMYIELANFKPDQSSLQMNVSVSSQNTEPVIIDTRTIDLPAKSTEKIRFSLPATENDIYIEIATEKDSLALDNSVLLVHSPRPRVRAAYQLNDPQTARLFTQAIEASDLCELVTAEPELLITDLAANLAISPGPVRLVVIKEPDAVSFTGPFVVDQADDMLAGTWLDSVIWAASRDFSGFDDSQPTTEPTTESSAEPVTEASQPDIVKPTVPGRPLVMAGENVLLSAISRNDNRNDYIMRWNPEFSTLQNSVNFPVLVANIINQVITARPGAVIVNYVLGQDMRFNVPDSATEIEIISPTGESSKFDLTLFSDKIFYYPASLNGIYTFVARNDDSQLLSCRMSVNSISQVESDLTECAKEQSGKMASLFNDSTIYSKCSWLFALLSVVMLAVHSALLKKSGGSL